MALPWDYHGTDMEKPSNVHPWNQGAGYPTHTHIHLLVAGGLCFYLVPSGVELTSAMGGAKHID